jgi:cytochrome c peroxidase
MKTKGGLGILQAVSRTSTTYPARQTMMRLLSLCGATALLFLPACGGDKPATNTPAPTPQTPSQQTPAEDPAAQKPPRRAPPVRLDMAQIKKDFGDFAAAPAVDNPPTPEKIALGKVLYHDPSLSKNGNLSCASCHDLGNYGQDGKPTSPGSVGTSGTRNSPTVFNAFRQINQFWDGREPTVEAQSMGPMLNPVEHGVADENELVAKIKAKPELVAAFGKTFQDGVTAQNFKLAVGAFERTLITTSRWDKFLDDDINALTNEEKRGLDVFVKVGCVTCHTTRTVGGGLMQKLGVYHKFDTKDKGKMEVTGKAEDELMFKVPMLLNVAKTAPYHHNGSSSSLPEVVKTMAKIQLDKEISEEEVAAIVTFLNALTGEPPAGIK